MTLVSPGPRAPRLLPCGGLSSHSLSALPSGSLLDFSLEPLGMEHVLESEMVPPPTFFPVSPGNQTPLTLAMV